MIGRKRNIEFPLLRSEEARLTFGHLSGLERPNFDPDPEAPLASRRKNMQPDLINAIGMVLMAIFTVGLVGLFHTKAIKAINWNKRIAAVVGGWFVALIVIFQPVQRCIELPAPFGRFKLLALCVLAIVILVDRKFIVILACVVLMYAANRLEKQFQDIVHYSSEFTTIDANTNSVMAKGCNEGKDADGTVSEQMWHTWFTGIYKIKQ
ncbi:hypothetical protein E4633_08915 [Geomonas terrae]|uniref:Uncharacterized protein n=1 Tax=Geomonas terrae TaxID=2562681 RepID=A0A4S1CFT8_9BACT|nr:hypothetical protein [Geomonas terrae]TGU72418.1 hypothetical protein E4633_08915 [Geomonas terrae]